MRGNLFAFQEVAHRPDVLAQFLISQPAKQHRDQQPQAYEYPSTNYVIVDVRPTHGSSLFIHNLPTDLFRI